MRSKKPSTRLSVILGTLGFLFISCDGSPETYDPVNQHYRPIYGTVAVADAGIPVVRKRLDPTNSVVFYDISYPRVQYINTIEKTVESFTIECRLFAGSDELAKGSTTVRARVARGNQFDLPAMLLQQMLGESLFLGAVDTSTLFVTCGAIDPEVADR